MDIHVSQMDNYGEIQKQLEKNAQKLEKANKKSLELKQNSKDIKDKIDKLKISKLNKDNYMEYFEEEEAEYSGGDFESQEIADVKKAAGYDGDVMQVNLISADGELIEKLSSKALMAGEINIDKLDSGEQVLVIAPAKMYITFQ